MSSTSGLPRVRGTHSSFALSGHSSLPQVTGQRVTTPVPLASKQQADLSSCIALRDDLDALITSLRAGHDTVVATDALGESLVGALQAFNPQAVGIMTRHEQHEYAACKEAAEREDEFSKQYRQFRGAVTTGIGPHQNVFRGETMFVCVDVTIALAGCCRGSGCVAETERYVTCSCRKQDFIVQKNTTEGGCKRQTCGF